MLWLHNWRELDSAVAIVGRFLGHRDLKEKVTLCISSYSEAVME